MGQLELDDVRSAGRHLLGVLLEPDNRKPNELVDAGAGCSGYD